MTTHIDDRVKTIVRFQWFIAVAVLIIILAPTILGFYLNKNISQIYSIQISQETMVGPTELCPGDELVYSYHIKIGGDGVIDRDQTVWRVKPPRTVVPSQTVRIILPHALEQDITETYKIPQTYFDRSVGKEVEFPPGEYIRLVSLTHPSRSTVFASTEKFTFTIKPKEECI